MEEEMQGRKYSIVMPVYHVEIVFGKRWFPVLEIKRIPIGN